VSPLHIHRTSNTNTFPALIGALYGPKHPGYWDLDIVTGTIQNIESDGKRNIANDLYVTRAIMFTNKDYRDWTVAKEGSGEWHTAHRSMEEFVKELRGEFGKLTGEFGAIVLE
jgi:hypothetical protein